MQATKGEVLVVSIKLSNESKIPVYVQIANHFRELIDKGEIKKGDVLPRRQILAKQLKLNINTIHHAYRILENEQYIYSRRGIGSFANPRVEQRTTDEFVMDFQNEVKSLLRRASAQGWSTQDFKNHVDDIVNSEGKSVKPRAVFVECHEAWTDGPVLQLRNALGIEVRPVVMADGKKDLGEVIHSLKQADVVITTHVHFNEVREIANSGKVIFPLDMHLSYDVVRELASIKHDKIAVPFLKPVTVQRLNHWIKAAGFDIDLVPIRQTDPKNLLLKAQEFKTWMVAPCHKSDIEKLLPKNVKILMIDSVLGETSIQRLKDKLSETFPGI